jgi:ribokinase
MATAMGANREFSAEDVDCATRVLARAQLLLVTFEIPVKTALHAVRRGKELGAFTILTPGPAERLPREALAQLDLLVPNQTEANILTGCAPDSSVAPSELALRLQDCFGLRQVVITMGKAGAFVADGGDQQMVPALEVQAVDTPGAGDAFTAGLAFGLRAGATLLEATRFGCLTGARAVTVCESIPSFGTLAQVQEFAARYDFQIPATIRAVVEQKDMQSAL